MEKKYSIMIVEDETVIRDYIVQKLVQISPECEVKAICRNGEEAINVMETTPVDIVITDIRMPIMDGLELVKELYFSFSSVKTIIISGYGEFEYAKLALKYHVSDYLLKPLNTVELQAAINRLLVELKKEETENKKFPKVSSLNSEQLAQLIKDYIATNFKSDITLSVIADEVGYTPEHLGRIFKKHQKISVLKFITLLRMNEAKKLLLSDTDYDIGTIGQMVGYADPLYFSRVFKKNVSVYPKEYKQRQNK